LCFAGITNFDGDIISANNVVGTQFSAYVLNDTPLGSDTPYMSFDIAAKGNSSEMYAIFFHDDYLELFTAKLGSDVHTCCTLAVQNAGVNCQLNKPIFINKNLPANLYRSWRIEESTTFHSFQSRVNLKDKSGYYLLYFVNCQPQTTLELKGDVVWKNPYGYLSGALMPYMMVFLFLACAYTVILAIWIGLCLYFKDTLSKMQVALGVVLVLCWLEMMIYSADWAIYNYDTGYIALGWNIVTTIIFALRSTSSWILLLLVCMGVGFYRHSMPKKLMALVLCVGIFSFFINQLYEALAMLRYTPQVSHLAVPLWLEYLLLVIVTVVDFGIGMWIFMELYRSLIILKKHGQTEKLWTFKVFTAVLVVAMVVAVLLFLVEFFIAVASATRRAWRVSVLFGGTWYMLFFCVYTTMLWLFRPSGRNKIFDHFQLADGDDVEMMDAPSERFEDGVTLNDNADSSSELAVAPATKAESDSEGNVSASEEEEEEKKKKPSKKSRKKKKKPVEQSEEEEEEEKEASVDEISLDSASNEDEQDSD